MISRILKVKNLRGAGDGRRARGRGRTQLHPARGRRAGARASRCCLAKEAQLAACGIRMGFWEADGAAGDLGGGSLEVDRYKPTRSRTVPRCRSRGCGLIDQTGNKIERALPIVDEGDCKDRLADRAAVDVRSTRVGGTWRALAKLHMVQTELSRCASCRAMPFRRAR